MILLNSDTETRPTEAMRRAIAAAEVGDEQKDEDPTVRRLNERVAALLGKEAGLFLPSGTMCNLIAVKVHTQPGDLLLADSDAHVLRAEGGGAALVSGVQTEPIHAGDPGRAALAPGVFGPEALAAALARVQALPMPYAPRPGIVCVEQTHNFGGGSVWPLSTLTTLAESARARGLAVHMDGARLLNACVATGVPAAAFCAPVDSAWLDFSKGLGAPIGAVLVGSREFIGRARRYKQIFGGAMRQAGIAAAACLYALDHHVDRLADDHDNARRLAEGLAALPGVTLPYGKPATNIVFVDVAGTGLSAGEFVARCTAAGVRLVPAAGRVRAVTHLDVDRAAIEAALEAVARALA